MEARNRETKSNRVFILAMGGADIFYLPGEQRIFSKLAPSRQASTEEAKPFPEKKEKTARKDS